jgi:hypothetical protein
MSLGYDSESALQVLPGENEQISSEKALARSAAVTGYKEDVHLL